MVKFSLGGVPMQISFYTHNSAQDFSNKSSELFPDPPKRCPFKDCSLPVKLKKHGYYSRYFISKTFKGSIFLRRYICPVCGRTISMLPMFCLQRFQYSGLDIVNLLHEFYQGEISLMKLIRNVKVDLPNIDRRYLNYYRKRIVENRYLIQYVLNLISPEFIFAGTIPENQKWVKTFLEKVQNLHPHVFFPDFSKSTGKSFMTSQNMIA
jgi:transposase-like protein